MQGRALRKKNTVRVPGGARRGRAGYLSPPTPHAFLPKVQSLPVPMKTRTDLNSIPPALRQLVAGEIPDASAIQAFLDRHTFPLVQEGGCIFVYRGDVEGVALRHWIQGLPARQPFQRIEGTDLWFLVLELPEGSRVEYKLEITENGGSSLMEDPLNPLRARDPFGANSVCHAHGYQVPDWTRPDPEAPRGTLTERSLRSRFLSGSRRLSVYSPAEGSRSGPYPLLVVHDGSDFLRYSALRTVLDNLIHRRVIPPLVAAMIDPGERLEEYAASAVHARSLLEELVPTLERRHPLIGASRGRCLMGASLGAVASLHAAAQEPGFFSGLLLQSGTFVFPGAGRDTRDSSLDPVARFMDGFRAAPQRAADRVFLSCGAYESLVRQNRALVPVLKRAGMAVRYVEGLDGHNWENWRDRLGEGLPWLFSTTRPAPRTHA